MTAAMAFLRSADPDRGPGASEGRCFLYVLPCLGEDLLKLGFSRNPLLRAQQLHRRYFEFFDLDRAFAVETDSVREARRMELALRRRLSAHNAPAPLTVARAAGGHSEWYRGAQEDLQQQAGQWHRQGHRLHRPLRAWLAQELAVQEERLFEQAQALLAQLQGEPGLLDTPALAGLRSGLLDALDACAALDRDPQPRLPAPLREWYRAQRWR